ncbi:MAG: terminase gpA endonuclease subunit [Smithella sp.]|jgi:phage terminase large subunit GpA-like protein
MTSAEPGLWRTSRTPYLAGIMDAFTDPKIENITIMASTQVGKTEGLFNCLAFCVDQDPGPSLFVKPTDLLAKIDSTDRLRPMFQSSPALANHLTGWDDDMQKLYMKFDHMILYLTGANSPAGLSSKPVRYLFMDEVDKFPKFAGKEASPIDLAEERTRTFWNRKIFKCSTPTTKEGYIYRDYEKSDKRRYFLPCCHCGHYQVLYFKQIQWPKEVADPDQIKNQALAWYECPECHNKINDTQKIAMLLKGVWIKDGQTIDKNGVISGDPPHNSHAGFWINALYSPWLSLSEIAAKFLKSKDEPETLMNFINSWLAEPWEELIQEKEPDQLKKHAQTYRHGTVPEGVILLTAGVDVQKDHFYYIIDGWGFGWESWRIKTARVETWEDVITDLFNTNYPAEHGAGSFQVILTCIDSGYNTDEVYDICRYWSDCAKATKGQETLSGVPYKSAHIDKYPGNNKIIPGGLTLYHLDTNYFKNKIHRWMQFNSDGITKFHLPENPDETYLRHLCSEKKVIERDNKGRGHEIWKMKAGYAANHYLDCEVYATAAAEILRVHALTKDDKPRIFQPEAAHGHMKKVEKPWIEKINQDAGKIKKGWLN